MKRLQPAEQEATRYLKFRIYSEEDVGLSDLVDAFWDTAVDFLGSRTLSSASPWIIANRYDEETQEGVIRVNSSHEDEIRAALTLIEDFGEKKGFIEVKEVSGAVGSI